MPTSISRWRKWTAIRAFILVPPVTSSERRLAYETKLVIRLSTLHPDLGFGALIEQILSAKSSANDGLVAIDCCLNQAPSIVTRSTLPAYSTMVRNHRNMPVALTRRRPVLQLLLHAAG